MTATDQRRSRRFELRLPFELVREGAKELNELGETMNLSSVGVLFSSAVELEIGSPIEYFITLQRGLNTDDGVRLRCVGKVVRRHDPDRLPMDDEQDVVTMAATLERYEFIRPA
jgi:hypothetical protein